MIAACLIIALDLGGPILPRIDAVRANPCVQITGYCASACTLHLAAKEVCIGPDAVLAFHGPSSPPGEYRDYYVKVIATYYPPALRKWYLSGPVDLRGDNVAELNADQAAALGVTRCSKE